VIERGSYVKEDEKPVHHREELLTWLNPGLDPEVAEGAGELVDAVARYLKDAGPTTLFDVAPPLGFDPVAASSYRPDPLEIKAPRATKPVTGAADPAELEWASPQELATLIRTGAVSRREVLDRFRDRIGDWDPVLNAFIRVTLPTDPAAPGTGSFDGVPIGVQDMIGTAGVPTTAGSRILADYVPDRDAEAWRRLSAEGAVLAGKLSTQEFAAGTTGENQWFGPVRNPWDPTRTAGGAAGGAGAAVAAGLVPAAIATDPGGSIRVPAALCGVVCLKPTYGSMDRTGSIPLTWTTETMGVLARTVLGTAGIADLLLDGRARARYSLSCGQAAQSGLENRRADVRVGVPLGWLELGLDPDVEQAYREALAELESIGATLVYVDLPSAADIAPAHRAIAFSEASSIHEEFIAQRAGEYGDNIRERQEAGRGVMASEYLKAFRLRGRFTRHFSEAWRAADVIAMPTSPVPAAPIGTPSMSTGSRGLEPAHTVYTRYSAPLSTLGLPALSVPCGFTRDGLPVGLQLCGPPHSEPLLFSVAAAYESVTEWQFAHPQLALDRVALNGAEAKGHSA
jgi:aspartyl-tRNA(Asn)/glutamyl-tRNA(Gln) amidotransferase subunit A